MRRLLSIILLLLFFIQSYAADLPLQLIQLPPHFKISIYADVPDARSMTLGDNGIVFVGSRGAGKVYALLPNKNFSKAAKVITLASNLNSPNGVAFYQGNLYVAEIHQILKFSAIEKNLEKPTSEVIYNQLPANPHHGWRYMGIGPDHWLYVAIGAPCNVCEKESPFASIARLHLDGKDFQVYAKGIRNSVGFDWSPTTKQLWFTNNERDWLGDTIPPDGLNIAAHAGMNFGFPHFWGDGHLDPSYGKNYPKKGITFPALELPAHVAPLGMRFYTGNMFPKNYFHQVFIAEHGSWNRVEKVGYRVALITVKNNKPVSQSVFASGWLQGEKFWGRPVDVLVMPDGSLLISDDYANVVYRVSYQK